MSELGDRIYERARRKRTLVVLGIATVVLTVILEVMDPSHVSHGPTILDFEFAGSHAHAAQIVAEWGAKGRSTAHLSLLLDYGYMLSYGLFFALAGFTVRDMARARGWGRLAAHWRRRPCLCARRCELRCE